MTGGCWEAFSAGGVERICSIRNRGTEAASAKLWRTANLNVKTSAWSRFSQSRLRSTIVARRRAAADALVYLERGGGALRGRDGRRRCRGPRRAKSESAGGGAIGRPTGGAVGRRRTDPRGRCLLFHGHG